MKHLLHAVVAISICSTSLAGGGDLYYGGYSKDKKYGFDLQGFDIANASSHSIPVYIFPFKTHSRSGDAEPEPITGCMVIVSEMKPNALVCGGNASSPAFRQAMYAFSGSRYLERGSKFTCVYRCSATIPSQFRLWETATGDD